MVHRTRSQHQQSAMSKVSVMSMAPPPPPMYAGHTGHTNGNTAHMATDQTLLTMCQCNTFLDPYPSGQSVQWRNMGGMGLSSALQHYCRVCNTQLNSCKQARIHVAGKKHEKRLAYLKFSLETSEAVTSSYPTTATAGQYAVAGAAQPPVQAGPMLPSVYTAYPPPCPAAGYGQPAPAYYFPPAASYPSQPPGHVPVHASMYHYEQQPPANQPPTSSSTSLTHYTPHSNHNSCNNRRGKPTATGTAPAPSHGVMSPSLTSGFSGSGDCKSTETCSLLSVASYSSATPAPHHVKERREAEAGSATGSSGSGVRHMVHCEVCHLPFPSRAVLEHHLMGSRHARKVKAVSVLRQLQENGAEFRATEATGDIRCEVCEVSVNSSHQLQAHMTGHKHKMRCARQGVAPNKTILTPASSTAPSTTPSEASAPVRSYSILVGRPQFGSRPNLYKTTATAARGGGRAGASGHTSEQLSEHRLRSRHNAGLNKLAKSRKIVRPRIKADTSFRQSRIAKSISTDLGLRCGGGSAAADSTTESDEPGTTKQKPQLLAKKQETSLDKNETVDDDAEESDEAKESEADQDSSNGQEQSGSSGNSDSASDQRIPRYSSSVNICQITKASQTDPLRRLSVDGCDLVLANKKESQAGDMTKDSPIKEMSPKEPRRRSVSASYSQSQHSLSNNNNNSSNYHCNLCQISVNSQSQLAQHMNSNKHRRLSIALQSHMTGGSNGQGVSGSSRGSKVWYQGEVTKESLAQSQQNRECNVREIPMLSMFLQRLHQHHYFPPIRDDEDTSAETHR